MGLSAGTYANNGPLFSRSGALRQAHRAVVPGMRVRGKKYILQNKANKSGVFNDLRILHGSKSMLYRGFRSVIAMSRCGVSAVLRAMHSRFCGGKPGWEIKPGEEEA